MKFSELTGAARAKALDKMSEWSTDYEWWDSTYEHFMNDVGPERGFEVSTIEFSGFYTQGQGAAWTGRADMAKWLQRRIDSIPADHPLAPKIVPELRVVLALVEEGYVSGVLRIRLVSRGMTQSIDSLDPGYVYDVAETITSGPYMGASAQDLIDAIDWDELDKAVQEDVDDFASEIFDALEAEYEYLTSEEACAEMAEANGYEFDQQGELQ